MSEHWKEAVNILIGNNWKCEICSERHDLTAGLTSYRCSYCHAEYDLVGKVIPKFRLKEKYKQAIISKFNLLKKPLSFWSEEDWDSIIGKEGL